MLFAKEGAKVVVANLNKAGTKESGVIVHMASSAGVAGSRAGGCKR